MASQSSVLTSKARGVSQSISQTCIVDNVKINYDTFGDRKNPAVLLIMGLASQKVRYPDQFCQNVADCGLFVIRYDNRDVGRSSRTFHHSAERLRSLRAVPSMVLFKFIREHRWQTAIAYSLIGASAWRHGRRRHRFLHLLAGMAMLFFLKIHAPALPYTVENMAEDAKHLLDSLGIVQAHIIGYSMGGMIAQTFVRKYPTRCSSIILMSTCSPNARLTVSPGIIFFLRLIIAAGCAFAPWAPLGQRTEGIKNLWTFISGPDQMEIQRRLSFQEEARGHQDGDAVLRQIMAICQFTNGGPAHLITKDVVHRTLVIHGQLDPLLPLGHAVELATHMQCKRYIVLPDIGHDILPGGQEEVLAAVKAHLGAHTPSSAASCAIDLDTPTCPNSNSIPHRDGQ